MENRQHVLIAGLGVSGFEAAKLALCKDFKVTVIDLHCGSQLENRARELEELGCTVFLDFGAGQEGFKECSFDNTVDRVVISPGIDPRGDLGQFLHGLGCSLISELEFAASFIKTPLIGVTGTNGKTTTVELLVHCLQGLGQKVIAAGNIGLALSAVAQDSADLDYIIVEVSSFQLEAIDKINFCVGAILNIGSDHTDRYEKPEDYVKQKLKLLGHSEYKLASYDLVKQGFLEDSADLALIDLHKNDRALAFLDQDLLQFSSLSFDYETHSLKGIHNAQNLLFALGILNYLGFSLQASFSASQSFQVGSHRMQHFLTWEGISFINDSKSTNPLSLQMALESLGRLNPQKIVLIAGGRDKKMDFNIVKTALCSYVRKLYVYGECRSTLMKAWKAHVSRVSCNDFVEAVDKALKSLEKGDVLLLSPGCSSLDAFSSYVERGDVYMKTVLEWTKK